MKQYKYIGTEEKLVEHGFEMEHEYYGDNPRPLIHGIKKSKVGEIYIVLQYSYGYGDDERLVQWNLIENDNKDITPYIQDLINDGLVEVIEI